MAGAVGLAGMAALRGGGGLVYVACPESIVPTVASYEPCYITIPLTGRADDWSQVVLHHRVDVIAIGPGMGQDPDLKGFVRRVLKDAQSPIVVDADGLNLLADNLEVLKSRTAPTILTPHPGEFSRLSGLSTEQIAADRVGAASKFAREHDIVLVLKGAGTIVADANRHAINQTGNPGMATGGTGDVLTGLTAALVAQGLAAWEAARLAVHLHGLAGDVAAGRKTEVSLIARDVVEALPDAFAAYK